MADETQTTETTEATETTSTEEQTTEAKKGNGLDTLEGQDVKVVADGDAKTTEAETTSVDWRQALSEKYTKEAERFTSLDAIFERNRELRKVLDASVQLPTDKSTPEEIAKYQKKIGIPEKVEDYKIEKPEWATDDNFADFMTKAHTANMTPLQIQTTLEANAAYLTAAQEAETAELTRAHEAGVAALKKEWGPVDYDANVEIARRAAVHFMGPEEGDALLSMKLEGGGLLGDHPTFLKSWANIGRATSESAGLHIPLTASAESIDAEESEIKKLQEEEAGALHKDPAKQAKISAWFGKKYGHAPADGRSM